jgi:two-component system, NtrC family, sensor kinase
MGKAMKRHSKAGVKAVKAGRRKAATPKRTIPPKAVPGRRSNSSRQETEIARFIHERDEALAREKASAEVLRVISSSPGELKPVFQSILENATPICGAKFGILNLYEGGAFPVVAMFNVPEAFAELRTREPTVRPRPSHPLSRAAANKETVQIADYRADEEYLKREPTFVRFTELTGTRTMIVVPMLKERELVGTISIYRTEVRPFTDKQIALVQNFAAQAVIAIENARLLNELRESLEQQTATSEVLRVMSSSPGELEPVFKAMLENATRICEAKFGGIFQVEDDSPRLLAGVGFSEDFSGFLQRDKPRATPHHPQNRVAATKRTLHIVDYRQDQAYLEGDPMAVGGVEIGGIRTLLTVPMLKDDALIGLMAIFRQEVRPFTDKQVELVENFAAQAVIAIENARLLNELRQRTDDLTESLEQQTATSEVLKIISSSPGELEPVFNAMLENATRICGASFGNLWVREDDKFRIVAIHGGSREYRDYLFAEPLVLPELQSAMGRAGSTGKVVQIEDISAAPTYGQRLRIATIEIAEARTLVAVPMLKDDEVVGIIAIYRQEVRPFTDEQIELVKNFAAQAVIAIENARLLNELRQRTDDLTESLEQQTATSEVLSVISRSPGELGPVFRTMLTNATSICHAEFGILMLRDGDGFRSVAIEGAPEAYGAAMEKNPIILPRAGSGLVRLMHTKQRVQLADLQAEPAYAGNRLTTLAGARTLLIVPLLKDDQVVGALNFYRQEVRPFTEKQIELVESFAAQAVIAIENTRLLSELRESLQQQTATSDVLKVISRSTFDLRTVLDTLVESAARLCEADTAAIRMPKDTGYHHVASYGILPDYIEAMRATPLKPGRSSVAGRVLLGRQTVHIHDVRADPDFVLVDIQRAQGLRTALGVPLMREGAPIGILFLSRNQVKPFTVRQIELVQTFADQAVIAIENVRLFEAEQQRTLELTKSLDDLRTAQDRLVQTQKLASLGQLTAGIAHEIKNPLNFVNNFSGVSVELIDELQEAVKHGSFDDKTLEEVTELTGTLRDNLDKIVQHGKRADSIVKNMLLHSREGSGERRSVDVNALVEESLNLAYHGARAEMQGFNVTLERSFDPRAGDIDAFPQEISRVLLNLIANGLYAANKRQRQEGDNGFEPTITAATKSLGDRVEIRIRDNGIGIPPEVREKMFNPFFTTKPAGEGTGLGLSISHDIIVKQHSGAIEVDTKPGEFTEFRIILPRAAV